MPAAVSLDETMWKAWNGHAPEEWLASSPTLVARLSRGKIYAWPPDERCRMQDLPLDARLFFLAFAAAAACLLCWLGGMI